MTMIFISGASGVGKSTVVENLRRSLPEEKFALHDIDESDLWTHDYIAWRDAKIDYWLQRAKSNEQFDMNTVLCGIITPQDVLKVPSFSFQQPIMYILLHSSADVHAARLLSKFGSEEQRKTLDEEHTERINRFVESHIVESKRLLDSFAAYPDSIVVDTTFHDANEVCQRVKDCIDSGKIKTRTQTDDSDENPQ